MAVNEEGTPPPLACGRDPAEVWDHATAGRLDAHARGCPYCTAAAADALALHQVVHRMAAQPVEPPPSVLERVMGAVRAELRVSDVLPLPSPHGPAGIARVAAAAVLRRAVDEMDGMRARSCRIEHDPAGDGGGAVVAVTVAARFGVDLASATARVRQMVLAAADEVLGVPVAAVDIEVVDVFGEEPGGGTR